MKMLLVTSDKLPSEMAVSRATVVEDLTRFAQMHSWYKHLSAEGDDFIPVIIKGQEPRNGIHPDIKDADGLHIHFYDDTSEVLKYHPSAHILPVKVKFNCFWRGVEKYKPSYSAEVIRDVRTAGMNREPVCSAIQKLIKERYPHIPPFKYIGELSDELKFEIFEKEHTRQFNEALELIMSVLEKNRLN